MIGLLLLHFFEAILHLLLQRLGIRLHRGRFSRIEQLHGVIEFLLGHGFVGGQQCAIDQSPVGGGIGDHRSLLEDSQFQFRTVDVEVAFHLLDGLKRQHRVARLLARSLASR